MSDFTNDGWSIYIGFITVVSIIACAVLLNAMSTRRVAKGEQVETTGHVWDGDLKEWNNPLPRWWIWLFYITIIFSLIYLVLYPGLGSYAGYFGWSSQGQYRQEQSHAQAVYGPIFDRFLNQDVKTVAAEPEARKIGERLFLTYCAQCHGSDAGGSRGFPSLRDHDWLHGGDPEAIRTSITEGRHGVMPPMASAVGGDDGVRDVASYVLKLGGRTYNSVRAFSGKAKFEAICAACHGQNGKGNEQIGAPNLTDGTWLWGGSMSAIVETISKGHSNTMPAHKDFLDPGKIHLLTAYVYGLSREPPK